MRGAPIIASYSRNTILGCQLVELTLKVDRFQKIVTVEVWGHTVRGFAILEAAVSSFAKNLGDDEKLILVDGSGATIEAVVGPYSVTKDWLRSLIVSARIVAWHPPT